MHLEAANGRHSVGPLKATSRAHSPAPACSSQPPAKTLCFWERSRLLKPEADTQVPWLGMWVVGNARAHPFLPYIHYANDFLWQEAKNKCIQDKGDQSKQHLQKKRKITWEWIMLGIFICETKTMWLVFLITYWHTAALPSQKHATRLHFFWNFIPWGPLALLCDGQRTHKGTWKANFLIGGRPWHIRWISSGSKLSTPEEENSS